MNFPNVLNNFPNFVLDDCPLCNGNSYIDKDDGFLTVICNTCGLKTAPISCYDHTLVTDKERDELLELSVFQLVHLWNKRVPPKTLINAIEACFPNKSTMPVIIYAALRRYRGQ